MRFLAGILITLGVVGLGLALAGDLQVDFAVHLGKTAPHPSPHPSALVLHASDNGKTVNVKVGTEVVAELGAGHSMPYSSNLQVLAPLPAPAIEGGLPSMGGEVGGGSYCGQIPPSSTGAKPSCAVPCPANARCANPCSVTPSSPPLPLHVTPVPLPVATAPLLPAPSTAAPGRSGTSSSPICGPCMDPVIGGPTQASPPMMGAGGASSILCQPWCQCQGACVPPMGGSGSAGSALPVACWPYCLSPMMGGTGQASPVPARSGSSAGGPASIMAGGCGQGHWRALKAGKADIIAMTPTCPPGAYCMYMPEQQFVVHIVVQQ